MGNSLCNFLQEFFSSLGVNPLDSKYFPALLRLGSNFSKNVVLIYQSCGIYPVRKFAKKVVPTLG